MSNKTGFPTPVRSVPLYLYIPSDRDSIVTLICCHQTTYPTFFWWYFKLSASAGYTVYPVAFSTKDLSAGILTQLALGISERIRTYTVQFWRLPCYRYTTLIYLHIFLHSVRKLETGSICKPFKGLRTHSPTKRNVSSTGTDSGTWTHTSQWH